MVTIFVDFEDIVKTGGFEEFVTYLKTFEDIIRKQEVRGIHYLKNHVKIYYKYVLIGIERGRL